ncbi:MAG TPA: hypothetical protein VGX28_01855 [Frankiaceae bacterium]|jgi:hypothetical protein|nr:hypothetical protein [Frankiaceae bacterium]
MRALALAAALAAATLTTPAHAAPMTGECRYALATVSSPFPTIVLTAHAVTTAPALEVGISCWVSDGGSGYANGSNPGVAVVATGTGTVFRLPFRVCEQHWARYVDGTTYTSPIACV